MHQEIISVCVLVTWKYLVDVRRGREDVLVVLWAQRSLDTPVVVEKARCLGRLGRWRATIRCSTPTDNSCKTRVDVGSILVDLHGLVTGNVRVGTYGLYRRYYRLSQLFVTYLRKVPLAWYCCKKGAMMTMKTDHTEQMIDMVINK